MQVDSVKNNNYQVGFNAKLKVRGIKVKLENGKSFVEMPNELKAWRKIAKNIGNENDVITLRFGKPESKHNHSFEMGKYHSAETKSRDVFAISKINGKTEKRNIGYYTKADVNTYNLLKENVTNYLIELQNKFGKMR